MFLNIVQVVEVLYSNLEVYIELKAIIKFRVLEKFTKFLKNNKCFHLPPPWRWGYAIKVCQFVSILENVGKTEHGSKIMLTFDVLSNSARKNFWLKYDLSAPFAPQNFWKPM